VKAAKSLLPMDKNVDIGGMVASLGAAIGASHSSANSAVAFEEDEEDELV